MEPEAKKMKTDRWSDHETKMLITTYETFMVNKLFDGTVRDSEVYNRIVSELNKLGVMRNGLQVRNRLKTLKRLYKEAKDKLRKSGAGSSISFTFYEDMDRVMGHRDVVNPPIQIDIGLNQDKENMNSSMENELSFEELDSTLPTQSTLDESVQEVENSSNISDDPDDPIPITISKLPCSSKDKKGRKRKRRNQYEEALKNVMDDVTTKVLDFEMKMEQQAEEKREAFREKLLKQQNDLMELFKKSIGQ